MNRTCTCLVFRLKLCVHPNYQPPSTVVGCWGVHLNPLTQPTMTDNNTTNETKFDTDSKNHKTLFDAVLPAMALHPRVKKEMGRIETTVLELVHLCTLEKPGQFVTAILAFASARNDGQLHTMLADLLKSTFALDEKGEHIPGFKEQAGYSFEDARLGYASFVDNFREIRNTPLMMHMRKIFALCVGAGVLGEQIGKNYPNFYKRCVASAGVENHDALDILDEVLGATKVCWNVAAECVSEGNLSPLLGNARKCTNLEQEHAWLKAHIGPYELGSLARITDGKVSESEFVLRVAKQHANLLHFHKTVKGGAEKLVVGRMLTDAASWTVRVKDKVSRCATRAEPFGILLHGTTSLGKTAATIDILSDMLRILGKPHTQGHIATVDSSNQWMDNVFNYTEGIILDDLRNTKVSFAKFDENLKVIQIKNTANQPVPKADVDSKGGVFLNCSVFAATTNVPKLQAGETSMEPSAVLRRFDRHIFLSVAPGHGRVATPGGLEMLDVASITDTSYPHRFKVCEWAPFRREAPHFEDTGDFVTLAENLNYSELLEFLKPTLLAHQANQMRRIDRLRAEENEPLCEHGFTIAARCAYCRANGPGLIENAGEQTERVRRFFEETIPNYMVPPRSSPGSSEFSVDTGSSSPGSDSEPQATEPRPPRTPRHAPPPVSDAEASPAISRSWRERVQESVPCTTRRWWAENFVGAEDPLPQPEVPALFRWWNGGADQAERWFALKPAAMMFGFFGALPAAFSSFTFLIFWGCGFGIPVLWLASMCTYAWTCWTVSASSIKWLRGRLAGLPLSVLRQLVMQNVLGNVGIALGVIVATLSIGMAARAMLRVATGSERKPEPEPEIIHHYHLAHPASCSAAQPDTPPAADTSPAPTGARDCAANEFTEVVERTEQAGSPCLPTLTEHGGAASTQVLPDPKPRVDPWAARDLATFARPAGNVKNMTFEQIIAKISRQLFVVKVNYTNTPPISCNALMVATNIALMPKHSFVRKDGTYSAITDLHFATTSATAGPVFRVKVNEDSLYDVGGDAMLVRVDSGGTQNTLVEHFASRGEVGGPCPALEIYRDITTYTMEMTQFMTTPQPAVSQQYGWSYPAFVHRRQTPTFVGLCGALVLAGSRYPRVLGIHTMGDSNLAVACRVSREDILDGLEYLQTSGPVRSPHVENPGTVPFAPAGLEHRSQVGPLHPLSVLREAPEGAPLIPIGTLTQEKLVAPGSRLGPSPISLLVEEQCGEPRQHGPPMYIGKKRVEVKKLSEVGELHQLEPGSLKLAAQDLYEEQEALVRAGQLEHLFAVLPNDVAATGVGASLRRINLSTSAGWPRSGNKRGLFIEEPTLEEPNHITLTPELEAEVCSLEETLKAGERINVPFKASHKDEPTKLDKEKTRIFECATAAFTFLVRKYFGGYMRFASLCSYEAESAVGTDCTSRDWHKLVTKLIGKADPKTVDLVRRIIEGDWKHYDTSLSYQEIMCAFSIIIRLYEAFGRTTPQQITIMWGLAEEVARHYTVMRACLVGFEGTNPSGNALTVIINNLCNGLRMRHAWYGILREKPELRTQLAGKMELPEETTGGVKLARGSRDHFTGLLPDLCVRFADVVTAIFYGDDFSMATTLEWFNQRSIQAWFASQGKEMTSAHKGAVTSDFTELTDATFLKRRIRYDPETEHYMAPLEMTSIYKSLHVWPRTLMWTPQYHAATLIDGAIRELFQHGREIFTERVPPLLRVAESFGARGLMMQETTYDAILAGWRSVNL